MTLRYTASAWTALAVTFLVVCATIPTASAQVVIRERVEVGDVPTGPFIPDADTLAAILSGTVRTDLGADDPEAGARRLAGGPEAAIASGFISERSGVLQLYYSRAERLYTPIPTATNLRVYVNGDERGLDYVRFHLPDELQSSRFFYTCYNSYQRFDQYLYSNATGVGAIYELGPVAVGDSVQFVYTSDSGTYGGGASRVVSDDPSVYGWNVDLGYYDNCLRTFAEAVSFTAAIRGAQVVVEDSSGNEIANHVQVARWTEAFSPSAFNRFSTTPSPVVVNQTPPGPNFIDLDPERFYIRVRDLMANRDSTQRDTVRVEVATRGSAVIVDDYTEIKAVETGENTGVFRSQSQLLVTDDVYGTAPYASSDDNYGAHDGFSGPVADDVLGDRTHRVRPFLYDFGTITARYRAADADSPTETEVPVCSADEAKALRIQAVVFMEPHLDDGLIGVPGAPLGAGNGVFDYIDTNGNGRHDPGEPSESYADLAYYRATSSPLSFKRGTDLGYISNGDGRGPVADEAFVDRHIELANAGLAQACITAFRVGPVAFDEAPQLSNGRNILRDLDLGSGDGPTGENDSEVVYQTYKTQMTGDQIFLFFAPETWTYVGGARSTQARGFAVNDSVVGFEHGDDVFVVLHTFSPGADPHRTNTLAHELGHVLANMAHEGCSQGGTVATSSCSFDYCPPGAGNVEPQYFFPVRGPTRPTDLGPEVGRRLRPDVADDMNGFRILVPHN